MLRFPLRIVLPALFAAFLVTVTLVAHLGSRHLVLQENERGLIQEMYTRLNASQGTIERFLSLQHPEGVKELVSAFGSDLDLRVVLATDHQGSVLSSTNYREIGRTLSETDYDIDPVVVERVTRNKASEVLISADGHWLSGYISICDPHASGRLRARHCGLLFHQIDLRFHQGNALDSLYDQTRLITIGISASALLMLFFAHRLITVRVAGIMSTLKRFSQGGRDRRTQLSGRDELADLSRSVDGLLDRITADEAALQHSEQFKQAIIDSANASIISTDADGVIQSFSAGAERMLGYSEEELVGQATVALLHDSAEVSQRAEQLSEELELDIEPGFDVFTVRTRLGMEDEHEWTYIRKDRSRLAVSLSVTPLYDEHNDISGYLGTARDITEEKTVAQRLRLAKQVFETAGEAILVTDAETRIIDVNPTYLEVTGYSREEVIGAKPNLVKSDRHDKSFYRKMWLSIERTGRWSGELWDRRKNGEVFPQWLTINAIRDDQGRVTNYVGLFKDFTQQKAVETKLERMAYYDPLTGLPNRALFRDRLEHEIELAQRGDDFVALMFIDLDRFKYVNDTLGHDVGDQLLIEAAKRIRTALRQSDTVARLGGDEFTVVLSAVKDIADPAYIADKLIEDLQRAYQIEGNEVYVGASIGLAIYPQDGADFLTLTKNADIAMYRAKQSGRGRYQCFTTEMDEQHTRRLAIEVGLRSALEYGQLHLQYQPKVAIGSRQVLGFEALLRWHHPELGEVSPGEFIPLAEDVGVIVPIGDWVMREACAQLKNWQAAGHPDLHVSVNLSARQFQYEGFVDDVRTIVNEQQLTPGTLEFELTEGLLMEDSERTSQLLQALRTLGINISIDDFGTGYSSLSYLKKFPIQSLKIDRSFVRDIATDPDDAAIVRAIVSMANHLRLDVVAEGVEDADQHEFLRKEGCTQGQGYLYARPLDPDQVMQFLDAGVSRLSGVR